MHLGDEVLGAAPARGKIRMLAADQSTDDIEAAILECHDKYADDYDKLSEVFLDATVEDIANNIWWYLRENVPYYKESRDFQTVRSPFAIASHPADCKCYALFAGGVIDSLNRKGLTSIPFAYRFASYSEKNWKEPEHVFLVLYPGSEDEIWIDPVPEIPHFDYRLQPVAYKDRKPNTTIMSLYEISGITGGNQQHDAYVSELLSYRNGMEAERVRMLQSGMPLGSPLDLEYSQAIDQMDAQLGGIVDDALNIGGKIIDLFKKKKPAGSQPDVYQVIDDNQWNYNDTRDGHQYGYGAAGIILGMHHQQMPPSELLQWLMTNDVSRMKENREWGRTVTDGDIVNYFISRGMPLSSAQMQQIGISSGGGGLMDAHTPGSSSGGGSNTMLLIGGAMVVFLLMNKKR